MDKFDKDELLVLSRIVDEQRDKLATCLINMETVVTSKPKTTGTKAITKIHKRYYKSWKKFTKLSAKLDKMR